MSEYAVNLVRQQTLPARKRRVFFLLMLAYVALSGVFLVVACASASSRFSSALQQWSDARKLDAEFRREYDTNLTIDQYGRQMEKDLARARTELEQIRDSMTRQIVANRVLIGIASALPPPAYLRNVKMDAAKRTVSFDVAVPLRQAGQPEFVSSHLIGLWGRDPALSREIQRIEATASERQNIDMSPYLIWKFSAKLGGGES